MLLSVPSLFKKKVTFPALKQSYTVVTEVTTSTFRYELIDAMAESQDYMILLMKKRYAQPLDKRTLTGGTVEECKRFLEEKTGKMFRRVK